MPPKRTVLNSAGLAPCRVPVGLALRRLVLFLALLFFGTGSGAAAGAAQHPGAAPAVDHGSAVDHVATAISLDIDGRPLGDPRADAPCESDTTDEGDADADGVTNGFEVSGVQSSRPLHTDTWTAVSSRSRSCCSPRAPPVSALLAPRQ